ncbi:ribosome biogenesis GTP-binding protein YihA/YsxC [Malacoplasma muris]|uniref:ribosome biogenesis GTP-binding protein YihA/YsxC n=1 Tax=Malacoplasma muris TaxID=2119 RepID=UPI00398E3265
MAMFIKSAESPRDWISDTKKEICFIGRSNVGKSSLINTLANNNIAKTSNMPGRTQLVNFFDFGKYRVVDLPGYGFANVSKSKQLDLLNIINTYLTQRENLICVFLVCDINVITEKDVEMVDFLSNNFPNFYILLNKSDKYSKSHFDNNKIKIASYLNVDVDKLIPISAKKKTNITKLFNCIDNFC